MTSRVIAFYLPQFHPIPENDVWWGRGFTEWRNVARAAPRFRGHHQPQLPADLGFYDLRVPETRADQALLAREHGIHGFCYYHYWFGDRRLLGRPLDDVLSSGAPDFPFCLCWANESWTRSWDGRERDVLIKQDYSSENYSKHISWLLKVFSDRRYITVDGKPIFIIYRPADIPELEKMVRDWRAAARAEGYPGLFMIGVRSGFMRDLPESVRRAELDALLDFQPNAADFPRPRSWTTGLLEFAKRRLPDRLYQYLKTRGTAIKRVHYGDMVEAIMRRGLSKEQTTLPCVFPSWDNTPRRRTPTVIQNLDPGAYERWLRHSIASVAENSVDERLVFINAWNEWAEGCHLEPDLRLGRAFLEATRRAIEGEGE